MITIRLTDAQRSALECAGLEPGAADLTPEDQLLRRVWHGSRLVFDPAERDAVWSAINERSNAEDGQAEETGDPFARRAAKSLANLLPKISAKKI